MTFKNNDFQCDFIEVVGERHTGTNYLEQLLLLNTECSIMRNTAHSVISKLPRFAKEQAIDLYFKTNTSVVSFPALSEVCWLGHISFVLTGTYGLNQYKRPLFFCAYSFPNNSIFSSYISGDEDDFQNLL